MTWTFQKEMSSSAFLSKTLATMFVPATGKKKSRVAHRTILSTETQRANGSAESKSRLVLSLVSVLDQDRSSPERVNRPGACMLVIKCQRCGADLFFRKERAPACGRCGASIALDGKPKRRLWPSWVRRLFVSSNRPKQP